MNRHFKYANLEQLGISNARYRELMGFVAQYPEWNDAIKSKLTPELMNKVQLVNNIAEKASIDTIGTDQLAEYIIKNVAESRSFWYLHDVMRMPYRNNTFWKARKRFFVLLNSERN